MMEQRKTMSTYPDWTMLEQRGLIQPTPGREEAVKATHESTAAKKAAQREAMQQKATRAKRTRK